MEKSPHTTEDFLACDLPAPELASRRAETGALMQAAKSITLQPDGVLLKFWNTEAVAHALVDFIFLERKCCSALTYELRSEPDHTELLLQLRAPKPLVASLQSFYIYSASV